MSKKQIIRNVIYYVMVFIFGALIAWLLPVFVYVIDKDTYAPIQAMSSIASSLQSEDYSCAMSVIDSYYADTPVFLKKDDEACIVIFSSATAVSEEDAEGNITNSSVLRSSYAGFFMTYGDTYSLSSAQSKAAITVTDKNGTVRSIPLTPDYDSDGDGENESVATYSSYRFIYFDIDKKTYGDISSVSFSDESGKTYRTYSPSLTYSENFFSDVQPIIDEYNRDYASESLQNLSDEFLIADASYRMGSYGNVLRNVMERANRSSAIAVLIYFIVMYIIGDLTVGKKYIATFVKFIAKKCFKVDTDKNKNQTELEEFVGSDYYSRVNISLDITEAKNLKSTVTVSYSNANAACEFVLLSSEGYSTAKRIKAGKYFNPRIELDNNYLAFDMPDTLVVDSYTMNIIIKIKERKQGVS